MSFASRAMSSRTRVVVADDVSNALLPSLQGKVIDTRVTSVDERRGVVTARTNVRSSATFKLSELNEKPKIGDSIEARVKWMNNPIGELDLDARALPRERAREMIWRELVRARDKGTSIQGRILNAVNGGYAIGIGGMIAFLPMRAYRGRTPPRSVEDATREELDGKKIEGPVVGELLQFKILKLTASGEEYRNIVVSGPIGGGSGDRRSEARRRELEARSWGPQRRLDLLRNIEARRVASEGTGSAKEKRRSDLGELGTE